MEDERIHRDDPERTGPHRNWNEGAATGGGSAGPTGDWQQAIENSVRMGYELIDSQIREGRKMAEQFGGSFLGNNAGPGADNMRSAADTMAQSFADLTTRWLETLTGAMAGGTPFNNGRPAENGQVSSETAPMGVEVVSNIRFRLSIEFEQGANGSEELFGPPLCDPDADKPALDVNYFPPERGRSATLRIEVPDTQPAGSYSAPVYDRTNRQLRGRITIGIPSTEETDTEPSA